jgi:hypothetical protein
VAIGGLGEPAQDAAAGLLDAIFACYPEDERSEAHSCLDANGGLAALHLAFYESHGFYEDMRPVASLEAGERARRGTPYWQVWRLEGPGAVLHFQGHPHVHAYVQVVRDPARANLGESLGRVATPVEGDAMRALLEGALRRATGEALAFHAPEVPIEGHAMAPPLRERLIAAGHAVDPSARHRIATTEYFASRADWVGTPDDVSVHDGLLRDALVTHLRAGGLATAG